MPSAACKTLPGPWATHLLVDFYDCRRDLLNDCAALEALLERAAAAAGATIVARAVHRFAPGGLTVVLVLAESHLSIHTWPEDAFAAADLYTCGSCQPELAQNELANGLKAKYCDVRTVVRGGRHANGRAPTALDREFAAVNEVCPSTLPAP